MFFDPPQVGTTLTKDQPYAEIESVKAVSDVVSPLSGEITEVNDGLGDAPENVNEDPYGDGWLVKIKLADAVRGGRPHGRLDLRGPAVLSRYTSATDADRAEMLERIGVASIDELFEALPEGVRLDRALDLPDGRPEQEVFAHLRELAARNVSTDDELSFLGAGMYDHYVPAIVDSITSRSEVLTPYTPYQPEVSQGTLQVMFEYQTAISELTGLPVSNATLYEGPSALGAAGFLARQHHKRTRFVISRGVHPHARETLATMSMGWGIEVQEIPLRDGVTDPDALLEALGDDVSAVFLAQPNFLGAVEDLEALVPPIKECGAISVVSADPMTLGVLRPPGDFGVDIAVGEGQPLGNRLDYGGPSFGFFAAQQAFLRRIPGRIAGETTDVDGRRGFVLTLQTREQHIRRERATTQHHDRPDAQRAGRDRLPELARPPRASWRSAS